jgi:hypothetical protein
MAKGKLLKNVENQIFDFLGALVYALSQGLTGGVLLVKWFFCLLKTFNEELRF